VTTSKLTVFMNKNTVRFLAGVMSLCHGAQTGSRAHLTSYPPGTRVSVAYSRTVAPQKDTLLVIVMSTHGSM